MLLFLLCPGPDETEWPRGGHSIDPQAMEPESFWRRCPAVLFTMETPLDDTNGHCVGLSASSRALEALWHLSLPDTKELCLAVSFCSWEPTVKCSHPNLIQHSWEKDIKMTSWDSHDYLFSSQGVFLAIWYFCFERLGRKHYRYTPFRDARSCFITIWMSNITLL